jgi:hypothetical protein
VTVFFVTSWRIATGRSAEVAETVRTAREIHREHGFGASAWQTVVAGSDPANLWYLLISSGLGDHFAQMDRLQADARWQDLVASRIACADPAASLCSSGLWRSPRDLPEVVIIPSQMAPSAQLVSGFAPMTAAQRTTFTSMVPRLTDLMERHGLTMGFAEAVIAGERTGAVSAVVAAASLVKLGESLEALGADPAWAAYQADVAANPDPPLLTTRTLRQELL